MRAFLCFVVVAIGCGGKIAAETNPVETGTAEDIGGSPDVFYDDYDYVDYGSPPMPTDLDVIPVNEIVYIDTAKGVPGVPATLTYKAILNHEDGTKEDVTAKAMFTLDDPSLGTFAGPTFTSVDTLPGSGATFGITTNVHATYASKNGLAFLTILQLRKTGDKRDYFFLVPYMGAPTPSRDILKFGTSIKQVDVAMVSDGTASMGGALTSIKTNLSTTLFPSLAKAIPSVGMGWCSTTTSLSRRTETRARATSPCTFIRGSRPT